MVESYQISFRLDQPGLCEAAPGPRYELGAGNRGAGFFWKFLPWNGEDRWQLSAQWNWWNMMESSWTFPYFIFEISLAILKVSGGGIPLPELFAQKTWQRSRDSIPSACCVGVLPSRCWRTKERDETSRASTGTSTQSCDGVPSHYFYWTSFWMSSKSLLKIWNATTVTRNCLAQKPVVFDPGAQLLQILWCWLCLVLASVESGLALLWRCQMKRTVMEISIFTGHKGHQNSMVQISRWESCSIILMDSWIVLIYMNIKYIIYNYTYVYICRCILYMHEKWHQWLYRLPLVGIQYELQELSVTDFFGWSAQRMETVGPAGLKCYSAPGRLLSEDCSIWAGNCWVKVRASDFCMKLVLGTCGSHSEADRYRWFRKWWYPEVSQLCWIGMAYEGKPPIFVYLHYFLLSTAIQLEVVLPQNCRCWLGGAGCTEHRPRVPDDGRRSMSLLAPSWALGLFWVQPFKPRRARGTKSVCNPDGNTLSIHCHSLSLLHPSQLTQCWVAGWKCRRFPWSEQNWQMEEPLLVWRFTRIVCRKWGMSYPPCMSWEAKETRTAAWTWESGTLKSQGGIAAGFSLNFWSIPTNVVSFQASAVGVVSRKPTNWTYESWVLNWRLSYEPSRIKVPHGLVGLVRIKPWFQMVFYQKVHQACFWLKKLLKIWIAMGRLTLVKGLYSFELNPKVVVGISHHQKSPSKRPGVEVVGAAKVCRCSEDFAVTRFSGLKKLQLWLKRITSYCTSWKEWLQRNWNQNTLSCFV